jgi:hypothetical protein
MRQNDVFNHLVTELNKLKEGMVLFNKRMQNTIDLIKAEIGPERWDISFRIAAFLAIKDVMTPSNQTEVGGKEIEFE